MLFASSSPADCIRFSETRSSSLISRQVWLGHVEPLLQMLFSFFHHLSQSLLLIRPKDRIHSILRTIENSIYLAQIQRIQVAQLIVRLLRDRPQLQVLLWREMQACAPAIHRKSRYKRRLVSTRHFVFHRTDCEKCADYAASNKDCNQRQNDFPSLYRVHDYKKQTGSTKSDLFRCGWHPLLSNQDSRRSLRARRQRGGADARSASPRSGVS